MVWLWWWMTADVNADTVLDGMWRGCGRGDGRNGAGELWRLFASGQVRSAGATYAGTAGEASGRANGFNHIDNLQSRSIRD